jgi:hypothetical protein
MAAMSAESSTPVRIDDHTIIRIETPASAVREEEIAYQIPSFDGFTEALSKIATSVRSGLEHVRPTRATVEFGVDVAWRADSSRR